MKEEERKKVEREAEDILGAADKTKEEDGEDGKEKSNKQAPLPGNGGVTDKYRWTQTLEEVTIYVNLPDNVTTKQLDVKLMPSKLRVAVKGQDPIIDGEWHKKIKVDDSIWTLESDGAQRTL